MNQQFVEQENEMAKFLVGGGFPYSASDEWPSSQWALSELWPTVRRAHKEQARYTILVWDDFAREYFTHPCKTLEEVLVALEEYRETQMVCALFVMTYCRARILSDIEFDEDEHDENDDLIMPSWAA